MRTDLTYILLVMLITLLILLGLAWFSGRAI